MKRTHMIWILVALLLASPVSRAGQLRLGASKVSGDQVTVPIMLDGDVGKGVSTLNFKLNYDPALFEPVGATAGKAASAADKGVQANASAKGEYLVIMMGLNQNTVASGEVANIVLRKVGSSENGRANLSLTQTTFASPEGVEIPSKGGEGVIELSGKSPAPGTDQASDTATASTTGLEQAAATGGKDSVASTPARPGSNATGSNQNANSRQSPTNTNAPSSSPQPTGAVTGPMTSTSGKGGGVPSSGPGSLAAAVQRVDAAHSALQAQTGGSAKPGGVGDNSTEQAVAAGDAAPKSTTGSSVSEGVDKAPPDNATIQLAKVVTPEVIGQAQKKDLENGATDGVQSVSAQRAGANLGLKVTLGCVVVLILGTVFVVRRKLFT